ncbi:Unconventional myosin-VIIa [Talaromyces islandicus]|uniref:Unconventional myosin-VIIa n=1 Tax=Talaromyces islandicus TaxID=28573 RepID=A0A0U1M8C1_TALIS|nr:Unconventional myosin-VIIa [Talaromyces islandicus]
MGITVGQVSGVIACVGVVLHIVVPLIAVIVFVSLLSSEHTAATWSVVNRQLQSTLWPVFLRADSANSKHVARRVRLLTLLRTFVYTLISVAAFVTPLGLKNVVKLDKPQALGFHYVPDASPFGFGTPVRYNRFSRLCGNLLFMNCPGATFGGMLTFSNDTGTYNIPTTPDAIINSSISSDYLEMFTSATSGTGNTLSGLFDVQYRVWSVSADDTGNVDGGKPYSIGTYRHMDTLVVRNEVVLIEGAVADMMNGGLGYRNHTVPSDIPYGAEWTEDLTWVEPATECVDTNLTFHFYLDTENGEPANVTLVDNGGFANLERKYPDGLWNDRQNPDLRARAYKAAWINNIMAAIFLNVTRPGELDQMNSTLNKTFGRGNLGSYTFTPALYTTQFTVIDGGYLSLGYGLDTGPNTPISQTITTDNFTDASIICQGWGPADMANYTNTGVYCGYLYGTPQRSDGGDPLVFERSKNYTQNLYVCASAIQQNIKTVSFLANSSSDISQVHATSIAEKQYPNNDSQPLWAIEHSNWTLGDDVPPAWGMVADRYENTPGFDTLRAPQLWLPAIDGQYAALKAGLGPAMDSLAQLRVFQDALYAVYSSSSGSGSGTFSGAENMAMNRLWSQLSRTPGDAAKIINLVWTELAATSTVGIKAVVKDNNESGAGRMARPYALKIGYEWAYAIPGFLVLLAVACISLAAFFFALTSRFSLGILRQLLNQTATGRVATNLLYPTGTDPGAETKTWADTAGKASLSFAAVEKEKSGQTQTAATTPVLPGQTMGAAFPGIAGGSKQGEYILMKENPQSP